MGPLSNKKRFIYFLIAAILFFVAIPFIILYAVGYRIDSTFSTFRSGGIFVQTQFSDVDIFLNGTFTKRTNIFQKNIFLDTLKPGRYTVEVKKDGYQAWKQQVTVSPEQVSQVSAFILSANIDFQEITSVLDVTSATSTIATSSKKKILAQVNPEYAQVQKLFAVATSTTATTSKMFQKVSLVHTATSTSIVWMGAPTDTPYNFCLIDTCKDHISLSTPGLRTVDFYPGRSDVVVIAQGSDIIAQQLDVRDLPPHQTIYQGQKPDFRFDGEELYIRDAGKFFKAEL